MFKRINVRGGDKGAHSPDRPVAYLPGNNLAGFGRTGTNLLKLGLGGSLPGNILVLCSVAYATVAVSTQDKDIGTSVPRLKVVGHTSHNT